MCHCGYSGPCGVCKIFSGIVAILLLLTSIAAAFGVYATHATTTGWVFGTTAGSAALITFIISIVALLKIFRKMCICGCRKMGMCNCGSDGHACPNCHCDPCKCGK